MKQIEILAFGGAAALRKTPQTPFKRCINYYSVNDPLLMVVPSAEQALRSGLLVGDGDDEFCFLSPRLGDPIMDHNLWGPTYAQALQWEGDRFQRMYVSPLDRACRFLVLLIAAIMEFISSRLNAALKLLMRPILLFCFIVYKWSAELAFRSKEFMVGNLLRPVVLVLALLIQSWRGEDKYEPILNHEQSQ